MGHSWSSILVLSAHRTVRGKPPQQCYLDLRSVSTPLKIILGWVDSEEAVMILGKVERPPENLQTVSQDQLC
jgi:hypothetical protein